MAAMFAAFLLVERPRVVVMADRLPASTFDMPSYPLRYANSGHNIIVKRHWLSGSVDDRNGNFSILFGWPTPRKAYHSVDAENVYVTVRGETNIWGHKTKKYSRNPSVVNADPHLYHAEIDGNGAVLSYIICPPGPSDRCALRQLLPTQQTMEISFNKSLMSDWEAIRQQALHIMMGN